MGPSCHHRAEVIVVILLGPEYPRSYQGPPLIKFSIFREEALKLVLFQFPKQ